MVAHEQQALFASGQRMLRYPRVRQLVVKCGYVYIFDIHGVVLIRGDE